MRRAMRLFLPAAGLQHAWTVVGVGGTQEAAAA
jgi:hypothetical protein